MISFKKYFVFSGAVLFSALFLSVLFSNTASASACAVGNYAFIPSRSTPSQMIATGFGGTPVQDAVKYTISISSINCDIEVNQLKFQTQGKGYTADLADQIKIASSSSSFKFVSGTKADKEANVSGLSVKISKSTPQDLVSLISYYFATVATSSISMTYMKFKDTNTGKVYDYCKSGCSLSLTNNPKSPEMFLVSSYPDVEVATVSSKLSVGYSEVANLKFTANSKSDVYIRHIPITLYSLNNITTDNKIKLIDSSGTLIATAVYSFPSTDLDFSNVATHSGSIVNGLWVQKGNSTTVKVLLNITKLKAGGSSLKVQFPLPDSNNFTWGFTNWGGYGKSYIYLITGAYARAKLFLYPGTFSQTITN